ACYFAYTQTLVECAQLACMLEEFRIANGAYPETLAEAISANDLERLGTDIANGEPLHFQKHKDGFLLYSVGANGTDENGAAAVQDGSRHEVDVFKGDWVFRIDPNSGHVKATAK